MTDFAHVVLVTDIETAVESTLKRWIGEYVRLVERQQGLTAGLKPLPKSWRVDTVAEKWPEDQLPSVMIISPGTFSEPQEDGSGEYYAWWSIGVGCLASAPDSQAARLNAAIYTAAIRDCLVNNQTLGGLAEGVTWLRESYNLAEITSDRTLVGGIAEFSVRVASVVTWTSPATDPRSDPTPPWIVDPIVESTQITMEKTV